MTSSTPSTGVMRTLVVQVVLMAIGAGILAVGLGDGAWWQAWLVKLGVAACFLVPFVIDRRPMTGRARYHRVKLSVLGILLFLLLANMPFAVASDGEVDILLDPKLTLASAVIAFGVPALALLGVQLIPLDRVASFSVKTNAAFFGITLALVAVEIYVRWTVPPPPSKGAAPEPWFQEVPGGSPRYGMRRDHVMAWPFPSNPRNYFTEDNTVEHHINAEGYRGPIRTTEKPDDVFRMLILGDSYAFGWGVRDEHTSGAMLEAAMPSVAGKKLEVITLAAPGYNSNDQRDALRAQGLAFSPDLVVVWYSLNDVGGNWDPWLDVSERRERYVGKPWYLRWFRSADEVTRALAHLINRRRNDLRIKKAYTHEQPGWIAAKAALREIRDLVDEAGARLVVVIEPYLNSYDSYRYGPQHEIITRFFADESIPCYDLLPALAGKPLPDLHVHPTDVHSNELAKQLCVDYLVERLQTDGIL